MALPGGNIKADLASINYKQRNTYAEGLLDLAQDDTLAKELREDFDAVALNKMQRQKQDELFKNEQMATAEADAMKIYGVKAGNEASSRNFQDFLFGLKDKVYNTRQAAREGKISPSEAGRIIADLNSQGDKIVNTAALVNSQLAAYDEALKIPPGQPGAVSVRTLDEVQQAMLGLKTGESQFVERGGRTYAVRNNPNDPKNPFVADLTEVASMAERGEDFFGSVPDLSETYKSAYSNVVKPGGKDNADLVMFETRKIGDQEATVKFMTTEQRQKAVESMVKANQFKGLLDDENRMKYVWADLMGKDTNWMDVKGDTPEEIEANIKKQRDEAAMFLAQKSIEDNAPADGIQMIQSTRQYKAPGDKDKGKGSSPYTLSVKEEIATYTDDYKKYLKVGETVKGDPDKVLTTIKRVQKSSNTGLMSPQQAIDEGLLDESEVKPNVLYQVEEDADGNVTVDKDVFYRIDTPTQVAEVLAQAKGISEAARQAIRQANPIDNSNNPSRSFRQNP